MNTKFDLLCSRCRSVVFRVDVLERLNVSEGAFSSPAHLKFTSKLFVLIFIEDGGKDAFSSNGLSC
jgi:hypothetical protein